MGSSPSPQDDGKRREDPLVDSLVGCLASLNLAGTHQPTSQARSLASLKMVEDLDKSWKKTSEANMDEILIKNHQDVDKILQDLDLDIPTPRCVVTTPVSDNPERTTPPPTPHKTRHDRAQPVESMPVPRFTLLQEVHQKRQQEDEEELGDLLDQFPLPPTHDEFGCSPRRQTTPDAAHSHVARPAPFAAPSRGTSAAPSPGTFAAPSREPSAALSPAPVDDKAKGKRVARPAPAPDAAPSSGPDAAPSRASGTPPPIPPKSERRKGIMAASSPPPPSKADKGKGKAKAEPERRSMLGFLTMPSSAMVKYGTPHLELPRPAPAPNMVGETSAASSSLMPSESSVAGTKKTTGLSRTATFRARMKKMARGAVKGLFSEFRNDKKDDKKEDKKEGK